MHDVVSSFVTTSVGALAGTSDGAVHAFRGIPCAVADRFAAPGPPVPWSGIRDARRAGPAAPQQVSRLAAVMGDQLNAVSERDCLTVNVWTPDPSGSLPVLFWLHGGAWASGSGSWSVHDGARLAARQGIVVVTANYRLGPLGYGYLAELDPELGTGNFGFADQCAALQWVAREIGAFGGDPRHITVGGQSAGAHSAALLASAPDTRRHVRRVLLQSAPFGWTLRRPAQAAEIAAGLLDELGIAPADVGRLREVPADELIRGAGAIARGRGRFGSIRPSFEPTATALLPWSTPIDALEDAEDDLEVMVGSTDEEMRAFFDLDPAVRGAGRAEVVEVMGQRLSGPEQVFDRYLDDGASGPGDVLSRFGTDADFHLPAREIALRCAGRGRRAHLYRFDSGGGRFGSCHCIELPYLFANHDAWADAPMLAGVGGAGVNRLTRSFGDAVGGFVRSGNPGWPAFATGAEITAQFDPTRPEPEHGTAPTDTQQIVAAALASRA